MKKCFLLLAALTLCLAAWTVSASAVTNGVVRAGLYYGSGALYTANAQIATGYGSGFSIGYYDGNRNFVALGSMEETSICVTGDGNLYYSSGEISSSVTSALLGGYHVQMPQRYGSLQEAQNAADAYSDAFAAFSDGAFYVRVGCYSNSSDAQSASYTYGGSVVSPSQTGVTVTRRYEQKILFQFDGGGSTQLALLPTGAAKPQTWFKSHQYYGGFEYRRATGGNLTVINVVDLEDYVKGVTPYEMSDSWPLEALKAQAVCARTYALRCGSKHAAYGFDVCATTDCQVYYGIDYGYKSHTATSDAAVDATAGVCMYDGSEPIYAVYSASNGGASESVENVWGTDYPYLLGKLDPYEASVASSISGYHYTVTYTGAALGARLTARGYPMGTVTNAYVSRQTEVGNVYAVTLVDSAGKTVTLTRESCRTVLGAKSQRFSISGGSGAAGGYYVNDGGSISSVSGSSVISGSGTVSTYSGANGSTYAITSGGTFKIAAAAAGSGVVSTGSAGTFTITGTGNGHNVGMSQWGANAMAKQGYGWRDILNFYYTDVRIG